MKKIYAVLLLAVVLSGCSLFQKQAETPSPAVVSELAPIPAASADFEVVMGQMHDAYTDYLLSMIPEVDIPAIVEQNFALSGEVTPPAAETATAEPQRITFNLNSSSRSDLRDNSNPQSEGLITFSGELAGEQSGDANVEIETRIGAQQIMAMIRSLEINSNGETFPAVAFLTPYVGTWYGLTFDELNAMMLAVGGAEVNFDIRNSFQSPQQMIEDFENRLRTALSEVHFWQLTENLPEENGMLRYRVAFDREAFQNGVIALVRFGMTNPDGTLRTAEFEQARAEIEAEFAANDFALEGVLSVNKENIRYFSFTGTGISAGESAEVEMLWNEGNIVLDLTGPLPEESFRFEKTGADYTLTVEEQVVLSGTWTGSEHTGTIFEENNVPVATFDFEKDGADQYHGTILIPEENLEITVANVSWTPRSFNLEMNGRLNGAALFAIELEYAVDETGEFTVEIPQDIESLKPLLDTFLPLMQFGTPAMQMQNIPTEDFDSSQLETMEDFDPAMFEGMEGFEEFDFEAYQ